jgi:membrane protein implicated in regulation of membrane protease activity
MTWSDIYLLCFFVGFIFSLVSMLSGHVHLHFHHGGGGHGGGHVHGGGHGHGHGHGSHGHGKSDISPFNIGTGAAFLAWFGGAGYLATNYYRTWFGTALAIALVSGLAGGSIVFWFLAKVLMGREEHLDPANYEMVGVLGTISGAIRPGGTGEILFSQEGSRRAAAARSEDGNSIPRGEEVVVTRYENGITYVRRWEELKAASDAMSTEKKDRDISQ